MCFVWSLNILQEIGSFFHTNSTTGPCLSFTKNIIYHRNNFNGTYVASSQESALTIPNILKLATVYVFPSFKIVNNKEVIEVIREVLVPTGPVICEVMIDSDEVVMSKVQAKIGKNGQMILGRLDDMWPLID